jgi:ketosteroid isomerase-like protein
MAGAREEPPMPSTERVDAFIAAVRDGRYVEAIRDYYAENATMQENQQAERGGRDVLMAHEQAVLDSLKSMVTFEVGPVLINGDQVVVNWVFEMTTADGTVRRMDELAMQTWRDDRIVTERFYYDPGQLAPTA